ncbi:MAG: class I SAM-dependent methyltransferase [Nitrospira defluvii]|nr:class I SAM-dependent methyltransferase [Nitrospira defluvii]
MNLRRRLYKIYWKLQGVIAPGLKSSQYAYEEELVRCVEPRIRWLELGCGHAILQSWRFEAEKQLASNCKFLVGLDYDLPSLRVHQTIQKRVRGGIGTLPFASGSFDLVSMNMVVEHLDDPAAQFREIHRVLSPGGLCVFHTPNGRSIGTIAARFVPQWVINKIVYVLEGREVGDIFPAFYRANTEKRIEELAHSNGFKIVKVRMVLTDAIFLVIPPLALLELMWIRLLMAKSLRCLRPDLVVVMKKVE